MTIVERVRGEMQELPEFERLSDPAYRRKVVDLFHYLYYHEPKRTWLNTVWLGAPISKCPLDLWVYQEMLFEQRPDVIVECGTYRGGSALYLASLCDLIGHGRIYTVDIDPQPALPVHPRIEYVRGSSTSPEVRAYLQSRIAPAESVLVILDSDHSRDHVLAELETYAQIVTPGSYIILEDTNVNGHPVFPDHGPGPMEALEEFLATRDDFEIDTSREKFFVTFNPRGYLRYKGKRAAEALPGSPRAVPTATGVTRWHHGYRFDCGPSRDSAQTRTLRLVGQEKRVLEVGCGPGITARYLKNQGCTVVGVEIDPDAAAEASQWCDRVIVGDLRRDEWQHELGSEVFDAVTVNDVLEHLEDPVACLRGLRRFVHRDGCVIASIPNIAHGSIRLALLAGEFEYRDLGLLDRTHLRFFTRRTVEELFDEAGYAIRAIERVELPLEGTEVPLPDTVPADLAEWLSSDVEARTYQFVIVAVPIRHGAETALRDRVRALNAENDDLRRQLHALAAPGTTAPGDDADIEDEKVRRRMLQLRATILDLRRQLMQKQTLFAAVQNDLLVRQRSTEAIESVLQAREDEIVALNAFVRKQTEESSRYAAALNDALLGKDDELRRVYGRLEEIGAESAELANLRGALSALERSVHERVATAEADAAQLRAAVAAAEARVSAQDEQIHDLAARAQAAPALEQSLGDKQRELDRIHGSRLWMLGSLYWRVTDRIRGRRRS